MRNIDHLRRAAFVFFVALCLTSIVLPATAADQYEYDAAGRLARVTYHTGQIVDYGYDGNGNVVSIVTSLATAVEPTPDGRAFANALWSGTPNPASFDARLRFSLAGRGVATLRFFDVAGRLVHTAFQRDYGPGEYEARVVVSKWPAGVYFYQLKARGFSATRRLVVLK